jgi:hypothetical protein
VCTHGTGERTLPRRYDAQPLVDRLTASGDDRLTLTLAAIAALIDRPLPPSATTDQYWRHRGNTIVHTLHAHGWHASVNPAGDRVTFAHARPGQGTRPSRLDPLLAHLAAQEGDTVRLSFEQLAAILGGYLRGSARVDPAWWDGREPHARKWEALGWEARLDIQGRAVEFRRIE